LDWCKAGLPPQPFDEQNDIRTLIPGGAWNVLMLVVMFEWITASFALLYLEEPAIIWQNIPMPPGVHPLPAIATIWNLVLLVIIWIYRIQLQIPDNNLVIFTFILIKTIMAQNYIARPMTDTNCALPSTTSAMVSTKPGGMGAAPLEWRTDQFLRRRVIKPVSTSIQYSLITPLGELANFPQLHSQNYSSELDCSGHSVAARFMEYTSTAPLLIVGIYLNFDANGLTWVYQIIFIALMATNMTGLMFHQSVLSLYTCAAGDTLRLQTAGWLTLIASWLSFIAGISVYMCNARVPLLAASTGIPDWVVALLWFCIIGYAAFGVVITVLYVPRLWNPDAKQAESWAYTFGWATFCLDTLSFVVKFAVAWVIYTKGAVLNCTTDFPTC
jgi:hypothetical protein